MKPVLISRGLGGTKNTKEFCGSYSTISVLVRKKTNGFQISNAFVQLTSTKSLLEDCRVRYTINRNVTTSSPTHITFG